MALVECWIGPPARQAQALIITLVGEHDLSTIDADNVALTAAVASCDGDLVIDVSGVTFMSAGTVNLIIRSARPRASITISHAAVPVEIRQTRTRPLR